MYLYWTEHDGRDCLARFPTEADARQCADRLRARGVQDLQLLDADGERIGA